MAFTMPVCKSVKRSLVGFGLLLAVGAVMAQSGGFRVSEVGATVEEGLLSLNARVDYALGATVTEALENGVSLVISQTAHLERARWWWRNALVVDQQRRYRLQYHAMSRRYVLTRLSNGESRSFRSLDALLARLGNVEGWPLLPRDQLNPRTNYRVGFVSALELEALPRLLRTVALVDSEWKLRSQVLEQAVTLP